MTVARGFTLIELMIALVVAGVVLAIGLPAFGNYRSSMALRQVNAQLLQDVRRARQLAITRRAPVVLRFGTPPTTTNITDYTIHVDANGDNLVQGTEMRTYRRLPANTSLTSVTMLPVDSLTFDISGILRPGTQGGRIIMGNSLGRRDTLMVSAAGVCYRP